MPDWWRWGSRSFLCTVRGYESVLGPLQALSARFHRTLDHRAVDPGRPAYRNALFHRLVAQTSCSRYLGEGRFTEYARELCRRGQAILDHDFP